MPMCRSLILLLLAPLAQAAIPPAPERAEGEGPFAQLILRGVTLIDGSGAPPTGPVDIVIEGNRIADIRTVGFPGLEIDPARRPALAEGGRALDLDGHYVLPGFIDLHGHIGGAQQGTPAEYVYKLWLGHGVTSIRDPGCGNGLDFCLAEKARSDKNQITAPRIHPYVTFGQGHGRPFRSVDEVRTWVREVARRGAEGVKFFGARPEFFQAALEELGRLGLRSAAHHAQLGVARAHALTTARWGLTTVEHWYGIPEALFEDRTVQDYPAGYQYMNEQHRFAEAGRLWAQAAAPGSDTWNAVMAEMLALDLTLNPTFGIYQATRDLMRARTADWHAEYTLPSLWAFFQPSRAAHGSFFFDWGTEEEVVWRDNFRRWMAFVNEYKNRGGRVTVGSDSGFIYQVYGFGYVAELEMLREAGFHPLEVIRAATLHGAEALGAAERVGTVEPGKLADLVVIAENPLANLKVLYGTGHARLSADNHVERVGGVRHTIKDGIVFDAAALRADVRRMVAEARGGTAPEAEEP
jgi:hypothetical protein